MTQNENFNMIVKKFILNEGLIIVIVAGYILGGGCTLIGFTEHVFGTIVDLRVCFLGIFTLIIAGVFNCLWYCLQKYDKMYGLFNNWEDGCDVCKQLVAARSYDSGKKYIITIKTHLDKEKFVFAKGYPLYCPHCGRKMSSFNKPRYW